MAGIWGHQGVPPHAWVSFVVGMSVSDLPKGHEILVPPDGCKPDSRGWAVLHTQLLEKSVLSPMGGCAQSWRQGSMHSSSSTPNPGHKSQKPAPYSSCACCWVGDDQDRAPEAGAQVSNKGRKVTEHPLIVCKKQ